MQLKINAYVSIANEHVIQAIADAPPSTLCEVGLTKIGPHERVVPALGYEEMIPTPTIERIRLAAIRGDVKAFIELTCQMLDEDLDLFVRSDHLLGKLKEVAHG